MIFPEDVVREADGSWYHSKFDSLNYNISDWKRHYGITAQLIYMSDDAPTCKSLKDWNPTVANKQWFLYGIYDTDTDSVAVFINVQAEVWSHNLTVPANSTKSFVVDGDVSDEGYPLVHSFASIGQKFVAMNAAGMMFHKTGMNKDIDVWVMHYERTPVPLSDKHKHPYSDVFDYDCGTYVVDLLDGLRTSIELVHEQNIDGVQCTLFRVFTKPDPAIVSGAIYDFAGHLTTQDKVLTFSASHDASPAAEEVQNFLRKRNLNFEDAYVENWRGMVFDKK